MSLSNQGRNCILIMQMHTLHSQHAAAVAGMPPVPMCRRCGRKLQQGASSTKRALAAPCSASGQRQPAIANAQIVPDDPRLNWARPEWIQQPYPDACKPLKRPVGPNMAGLGSSDSSSSAARKPLLQSSQRHVVNKVMYGSYSSDEDDDTHPAGNSSSSSNSNSWSKVTAAQDPLLYQAMGIDFGEQRVGIAVRRCSHHVPLLTLHREQLKDSRNSKAQRQQQQQQQQQQQRGKGTFTVSMKGVAAAVLHMALQEGCDGFVIGLPVYADNTTAAASPLTAIGQMSRMAKRPNNHIRAFAAILAELSAPLELSVLLVNEQQSSQQARAIMSGAAVYDVKTMHELQLEQQGVLAGKQQQDDEAVQWPGNRQQKLQIKKLGRDAFAAAVILSRYYNGLVIPERVLATHPNTISSSNNSINSTQGRKKRMQMAALDLRRMMVPLQEQRRRHQQRLRMQAQPASANNTAADASSG